MDQRSTARRYGWYLGIIAGVFAAAQVLISTTAALANAGNLSSAQIAFSDGTADPQFLVGQLLPPVVASYGAMILTGAVMLYLARHAGWLAAYVSGRREAGLVAGGWVALISALIWVLLSSIIVLRVHADGTVTGLFTANPGGPLRPFELPGLLIQEFGAGLIGWGLGSLSGQMGAAKAPLPPPPTTPRQGSGWPATGQGQQRGQGWPGFPPPSAPPVPPSYSAWSPYQGTSLESRSPYHEGDDPASVN